MPFTREFPEILKAYVDELPVIKYRHSSLCSTGHFLRAASLKPVIVNVTHFPRVTAASGKAGLTQDWHQLLVLEGSKS